MALGRNPFDQFDEQQSSLVNAVKSVESGGRRYANDGSLLQGPQTRYGTAKGEMQVLDGTASDPGFGVKPAQNNSPDELARVGRDYIGAMVNKFGGDTAKGLAAYNWGPGNVEKAVAQHGDNWMKAAPAETQKYVQKATGVMNGQPQIPPGYVSTARTPPKPQGNPFDTFDSAPADKPQSASSNPFDKFDADTSTPVLNDAAKSVAARMGVGTVGAIDNLYYNIDRGVDKVGRALGFDPGMVKRRNNGVEITPEQQNARINEAEGKYAYQARTQEGQKQADDVLGTVDTAIGWIPRGFAGAARGLGADETLAKTVGDVGATITLGAAGRVAPRVGRAAADTAVDAGKAAYSSAKTMGGKVADAAETAKGTRVGKFVDDVTQPEKAIPRGMALMAAEPVSGAIITGIGLARGARQIAKGERTFSEIRGAVGNEVSGWIGGKVAGEGGRAAAKDAYQAATGMKKAAPATTVADDAAVAMPKAPPAKFEPTPSKAGESVQAAKSRRIAERDDFLKANGMEPNLTRNIVDFDAYKAAGGKLSKADWTDLVSAVTK